MSSMKTSGLTFEEPRASYPGHCVYSFHHPIATGIANWHHVPFTFHTGKQGKAKSLVYRSETCFIQSLTPEKQKFFHMSRLAQPQVHPLRTGDSSAHSVSPLEI